MRKGHVKLFGYPGLLLGLWLLSLAMMSGGAWFIQEWRYEDLAARSSEGQGTARPIYMSTGQMQVVNGDTRVYMTSDGFENDAATQERRWRDQHPFQGVTSHRAAKPAYNWGASTPPSHLPEIRPLQ